MKKPIFLTALLLAGVTLSGCVPLDDGYHGSRPVYRYGGDADYHYRVQERRDWERRQARQQREMQRRDHQRREQLERMQQHRERVENRREAQRQQTPQRIEHHAEQHRSEQLRELRHSNNPLRRNTGYRR